MEAEDQNGRKVSRLEKKMSIEWNVSFLLYDKSGMFSFILLYTQITFCFHFLNAAEIFFYEVQEINWTLKMIVISSFPDFTFHKK